MKPEKMFFFFLALLLSAPLFALRPGDKTGEVDGKVRWLASTPMELGVIPGEKRENAPKLRALVFFFCRAANSDSMIEMLEQCRQIYAGKIQIAAISPDQANEMEQFRKRHSEARIRFAADLERKITPRFTEGSMLLPLAFLLDCNGEILWSGEAVDLSEAISNVLNGKNDVKLNRKLSPMIDEMQQWMRDGSEIHLANTAAEIFKLAPGQPTALRMRLFTLENRGRFEEAMQLVDAQIKAAPQIIRLYFTALDLMRRYPALRGELPSLAERFVLTGASTAARCTFADTLLVSFPGNIGAIESAQLILDHTPLPAENREKAMLAQSRARLAYVMTDLDGAVSAQQEAVEALRKESENLRSAAQKQLDFFRKLKSLRTSGKK